MTDREVLRDHDRAQRLIDARRIRSGLRLLGDVVARTQDAAHRMLASYNLGVLHWSELCDGVQARRWFMAAVDLAPSAEGFSKPEIRERMTANACENLMLLSLSFEEYESWAARLEQLQPDNLILHQQRMRFREDRAQGRPWSDALQSIAHSYYNRGDTAQDRGRYAEGASTWQLLLEHRAPLRLPRDEWRLAIYEYGALAMRVAGDAMMRLNGQEIDEYLPTLRAAQPRVAAYRARYPADAQIRDLEGNMRQMAASIENSGRETESLLKSSGEAAGRGRGTHAGGAGAPESPGLDPFSAPLPPLSPPAHDLPAPGPFATGAPNREEVMQAQMGCTLILIALAIGGGLGYWLYGYTGMAIGMAAGFLLGAGMAQNLTRSLRDLATRCAACGRRFLREPPPPGMFPGMPGMGVAVRTEDLMTGRVGVGRECTVCGRTYCSNCEPYGPCACGAARYRSVALRYRH